jgi:hypothetical protein
MGLLLVAVSLSFATQTHAKGSFDESSGLLLFVNMMFANK